MGGTTSGIAATLCALALVWSANPAAAAADMTLPEAYAIAEAGVVQSADVPPGYYGRPAAMDAPDHDGETEFYACLGAGQPRYLARNRGASFRSGAPLRRTQAGGVTVHSAADVAETEQAALADQQNLGRAKGARCYEKRLTNHLRAQRLEPKEVSVDHVPAMVAGADEAWAYRVRFVLTRAGDDVAYNGYQVEARVGHALLSVSYLAGAARPALATVTELAAKPVARVRQVPRT